MKYHALRKIFQGLMVIAVCALAIGAVAHAQMSTTTGTTTGTTGNGPIVTSVSYIGSSDGTTETISWLTDASSTSQVSYGLNSFYGASTTLDSAFTTNHTVTVTGLTPNTTYHFQAVSTNNGGTGTSGDMMFTTLMATSTTGTTTNTGGTGMSTNITDLQNQISTLQNDLNSLQSRLNTLWQELSVLLGNNPGNGNTGGNTGGTTSSAPASILPLSATVSAGNPSIVDFNGRNFGPEETVNVTLNGQQVTSAHADGGGNFTTGSMTVPSTAGTYTYTFKGTNSGTSLSSVITVK